MLKLLWAGKDAYVFYISGFANHDTQYDFSLNLGFLGVRRIDWHRLGQNVSGHFFGRNGELFGRFGVAGGVDRRGCVCVDTERQRRSAGCQTQCSRSGHKGYPADGSHLFVFSGEVHKSPFKRVGIEDSDGVRCLDERTCYQQGRQPQEGLRIFISSSHGRCHLVTNHFAALHNACARKPEQGMVGHGQGKQFIDEVLEKVSSLHVRKLMRNDGMEICVRQHVDDAHRQEEKFSPQSHGHGTKDSRGSCKAYIFHSKRS